MILEARAANCFSSTFVLKIDDRPVGKYEGRWFSETIDIYLTERRQLEFRRTGWLSSQFELIDARAEELLGHCDRSGIFTSSWDVTFGEGAGQLVSAGWFETAYEFTLAGETLARVDRLGMCERGWIVDGAAILPDEDLILIGLIYHVIQKRRNQQNQGGAAAAGT